MPRSRKIRLPPWNFTEAELDPAATAFNNLGYVDIAVNFYLDRLLYAPGDNAYATLADELDKQQTIMVPSVTLDPMDAVISLQLMAHRQPSTSPVHEYTILSQTVVKIFLNRLHRHLLMPSWRFLSSDGASRTL